MRGDVARVRRWRSRRRTIACERSRCGARAFGQGVVESETSVDAGARFERAREGDRREATVTDETR